MPKKKEEKTVSGALGNLLSTLDQAVSDQIMGKIESEMSELHEMIKKNAKLDVQIGDVVNVVKGTRHAQLESLIVVCCLRLNALLVGMAGTGKTHAAEQVAEAMGFPFYAMSVGAQTSKSDIVGYMNATGEYVRTHFREAYENGGVFLMDEIDAGNANVLIQVNSALSNGFNAFPDKMVKRHENFVFIASANTYGNGANRQYVGRNQLDAATLDRFTIIDWVIDPEVEKALVTGENGQAWYHAVLAAREYVMTHSIRALVTPRATQKGCKMLAMNVPVEEVVNSVLLGSVPEDNKAQVTDIALKAYREQ